LASDVKNLADFFVSIGAGRNDQGSVKEIDGQTMRRLVVGASDLGDTSVGGHHHDGGGVTFEGSVQERVALDIEHMHLIDEQNTWHDFCSSFLTPLGNLLVNLLSDLGLDFTNVSSEEGHESLSSRVDDVNFVKGDGMHDLLSLLELSLRALNVSSLRSGVVEVTASCETSSKL